MSDTIVSSENFDYAIKSLAAHKYLSIDTETTGLRVHHGDKLFSIAFGFEDDAWYFNFGPNAPEGYVLTVAHLRQLQKYVLSDPHVIWFAHNAKFDLLMLRNSGVYLTGEIWDTEVMSRLEYNVHLDYSLGSCAKRIGLEKSSEVDDYIEGNSLWKWEKIPGKDRRVRKLFFTDVPFDTISKYACQDARITYALGMHQRATITAMDDVKPSRVADLWRVATNEMKLTEVTAEMEVRGVLLDQEVCKAFIVRLEDERAEALTSFRVISGGLEPTPTTFKKIWGKHPAVVKTDKGNLSFDADVLDDLVLADVPGATEVARLRFLKNRLDFLHGFLYHCDNIGVIHTNFRQSGTKTGRFSSTSPNLQNLAKPDPDAPPDSVEVRKCIVPRLGYCFVMMDMDQAEYRLMLDMAGATGLIKQVLGGLDVHQATADIAGISRKEAKQTNFAILYGSGIKSLAAGLKVDVNRAKAIKSAIFDASPEIPMFIKEVERRALLRGYVVNWFGRRSYLDDPNLAYKMPNALIQGGVADVVKCGMQVVNSIFTRLKSGMVLNVHDELIFEIHESELHIVPQIHAALERIYPYKRLPLTWGISHSWKNLAEKKEGPPLQEAHQ